MNIKSIVLVEGVTGHDEASLETDLPAAGWPFEGTADVKLAIAHGDGERYCRENFPGVPITVFRLPKERVSFRKK